MRFLGWLVFLPFALAIVVIATANRHAVELSFDPLPWSLSLPLYGVLFAGLILGLLLGLVAEWWFQRRWRRDARLHRRLAQSLSAENERLRGERARPVDGREIGPA